MPIIPDRDPNEAYEVVPMKAEPYGPPPTWWTVTCNGIPVHHFTRKRGATPNAMPPTRRIG